MIQTKCSYKTRCGRALGTVPSRGRCPQDSVGITVDTVSGAHSDHQKRVDGWLLKQLIEFNTEFPSQVISAHFRVISKTHAKVSG